MTIASEITPNFPVMKAWQNWVLVASVLFLTGVVFHLVATNLGASNSVGDS
jgi:hypothetical protein